VGPPVALPRAGAPLALATCLGCISRNRDTASGGSARFRGILQVDGHGGYRARAERTGEVRSYPGTHVCLPALSVAGATHLR